MELVAWYDNEHLGRNKRSILKHTINFFFQFLFQLVGMERVVPSADVRSFPSSAFVVGVVRAGWVDAGLLWLDYGVEKPGDAFTVCGSGVAGRCDLGGDWTFVSSCGCFGRWTGTDCGLLLLGPPIARRHGRP